MAGRSGGLRADEQRVAVAVQREGPQVEHVARGLALAPQPATGPRVEVDVAGAERRGEGLDIEPADHQHAAVGDVLDDAHDETRLVPADGLGVEAVLEVDGARSNRARGGHAAAPASIARTGSPAAAIAALASAIVTSPRWKIPAARTASAWPSRIALMKSAGPAAPPDAMTGTGTRVAMAASSSVS